MENHPNKDLKCGSHSFKNVPLLGQNSFKKYVKPKWHRPCLALKNNVSHLPNILTPISTSLFPMSFLTFSCISHMMLSLMSHVLNVVPPTLMLQLNVMKNIICFSKFQKNIIHVDQNMWIFYRKLTQYRKVDNKMMLIIGYSQWNDTYLA